MIVARVTMLTLTWPSRSYLLSIAAKLAVAWLIIRLVTSVIRNGSRLNEVLVVKLDPAELDDETRAHAAEGIVAYSAICSHAGCPVTGWLKGEAGDNDVFKCFCHNSEFDPRHSGQVVFGPAPRRLAVLPLTKAGGSLTVAATFVGKVGAQQAG